jgi:hypothetical protein
MALRSYEDGEGAEWRVWSVVPLASAVATLDEEFRGGWLCFERADGKERRRLAMSEVPAGWESLPDDRLDLLRRVGSPVAAPSSDGAISETITGKRPIENAARDRPSGPRSAIAGGDERAER